MRKISKKALPLLIVVFMLAQLCAASAWGTEAVKYKNETALADSLTYSNSILMTDRGRVETFALELQPGEIRQMASACDTVYGGMTINDVIKLAESSGYNVLAAVNTDFYSTANHIPLGIVIENGIYKSSPEDENALCVDDLGNISVARGAVVTMTLLNNGGAPESTNVGQITEATHFNKYRSDTGLYLYSSDFSTVSTRAPSEGWAVRFKILSGELTVNSVLELQVEETLEAVTDAVIGEGYLVLTAAAVSSYGEEFLKYAVGDRVTLTTACADAAVSSAKQATGGRDVLVENGALTDSAVWDSGIAAANPRTAVGAKADGTVVYSVIDGRSAAHSQGATLLELAEHMLSLGCVWAMNLDGGGSSAMSVRMPGNDSCTIVNSPSDGTPRRCGAYMLLVADSLPDGAARRLFLQNDGAFVLTGASVELAYAATDGGYNTAVAPTDIAASPSQGVFADGVYTAGQTECEDTVTLTSASTGASGSGTLHVVTKPHEIKVTNAETGKAVKSLSLARGESVALSPSVTYLSRSVIIDENSCVFTVNGDIGAFADGVFTAGSKSNVVGSITVSAGEKTLELPVSIPPELEDVDGHWSEEYVRALHKSGVVKGVTDTTFEPNSEIRRSDFILMLYRAYGSPPVEAPSTFTDVPADAYYADAVAWAETAGIAKGNDDGSFAPGGTLLREQGFTFIYRYMALLGKVTDETPEADMSAFSDAAEISEYAVRPASVLAALGIVGGADGEISPQAGMTRGQMAKVLFMSAGQI